MGIAHRPNNLHWNYFLALDADTAKMSRFVEFSKDNYRTYSLELARLLMAAAAEVDVVAKIACLKVNPSSRAEKIGQYYSILTTAHLKLRKYPIQVKRFGLMLKPSSSWSATKSPLWWTAYNKTKHQRNTHFQDSNLKNALNAVAGLYVMLLYAFPEDASLGTLLPRPQLFSVPDSHITGYGPAEDGSAMEYLL